MKCKSIILLSLVLVLLAFMTGCDKRNPVITKSTISSDSLYHIVKMEASTDTIYADNGITFANISVYVKDNENFAAPNVAVLFRTNLGGIIRQVTTDSAGVAKTTFYSRGADEVGIARVEAFIRASDGSTLDSTSTAVHIIDIPPVSNLTLEMSSTIFTVDQVVTLTSKAKNILGMQVPDNTMLTFSATRGYFLNADATIAGDSILVKTSNGSATVSYNAGPLAGDGAIRVRIGAKTVSRSIEVNPGRPAHLLMSSYVVIDSTDQVVFTDECAVNSPDQIYIRALVSDTHNNVCPNALVRFETSLGSFINTNSTITKNSDSLGIADVNLTPGLSAGRATIKGFANGDTLQAQVLFTITSDEIYSIQFQNTGQINLNVAYTGGTESAILKVNLYDINGNLIDSPTNVSFQIINNAASLPAGANLNNQGIGPVYTVSSGGVAQVSVNSGTESGVLNIRATAIRPDMTTVTATKTNVVIHSGAPHQVILNIGAFNTGKELGGGLYRVQAEANVKDVYGNPVEYGTGVWFSLPAEQPNASVLANCSILANAYVGNENADGDSLAGVAYTSIVYNGVYSLEMIRVQARTGGINGTDVTTLADLLLPLNGPTVEAQALPGHIDWFTNNLTDKDAIIRVSVLDGQGNPIHGAKLTLTSDRGTFIQVTGTNVEIPNPNEYTIVTDWYNPNYVDNQGHHDVNNGNDGIAEGKIRFRQFECPNPDPVAGTPGQYNVQLNATLLGTGMSGQAQVILLKYPVAG